MSIPLKYAVVERERRFLVASLPEVACTSLYLDDQEWTLLCELPTEVLRKTRHMVHRHRPSQPVPDWLDVVADVSHDERWTGASLAR